jgi:nucleoside-diphosphate-sugar epimerase
MERQTILGAGGIIGKELARILPEYTTDIRLVSRHPEKVNAGDTLFSADLNNAEQVAEAVTGSAVVYLTAGLPYRAKTWQQQWPRILENTIQACKKLGACLIFFDNFYSYGKTDGAITEQSPHHPSSKKGKVRLALARMLESAWSKGEIEGAIVRAADFYGPGAANGVFNLLVADKLKQKKKAQWLCNDQVRYSMTFTPDAARGTAMVGNTTGAMNQVWHLPTSAEEMNAASLIALCAETAGAPSRTMILKKWMLQLGGLFDPTVGELIELLYEYQYDYIFDSSKFEKQFDFKATPYREGIKRTLQDA